MSKIDTGIIQQITRWASINGKIGLARKFFISIIGNTIIATLISLLMGNWLINLIISQCIGLSVFSIAMIGERYVQKTKTKSILFVYLTAIVLGSLIGVMVAWPIIGVLFPEMGKPINLGGLSVPIYLGLFFGAISSYIHYTGKKIEQTAQQLRQEENVRLKQEKQLAEAQLKLIQAQIEPHFLFNTLATIDSLIMSDPKNAQYMLQQLNQYLRTSLSRTRNGKMSLRHEIELITAYLEIIKIRMGERLNYKIDVDEASQDIFIPALLLQPIVENAIQHGLEPKADGGYLSLRVRLCHERLLIEINDSGIGDQAKWGNGTGLSNVRERVKTFYRDKGTFSLSCTKNGSSVLYDLPVHEFVPAEAI